jgi:type I restriction enzyme M protein
MPDQEQLDDFLEALETAGSPAKNPVLRQALGWEEALYEEAKAELVARGIVVRGRGRSDSVSLVGAEPAEREVASGRAPRKGKATGTANLGFEAKLWLTADKLRNNMDAAEYKHVVLGLIFLKYISDSFEEQRAKLLAGEGDNEGANPEDPDEYKAENVFWVPADARWSHLQANAKQPTIGKLVDDAMVAIERDNPRLKGVLPKDYARPGLDKQRLGELIDVIATIELTAASEGEQTHRSVDLLGRVYEYFLTRFASAEGRTEASSTRRAVSCAAWWRCWSPTRAASTTPAAAPAACSCRARSSWKTTAARSAIFRSTARKATPPRAAWR